MIAVPDDDARPRLRVIPRMESRAAEGTVRIRRVEADRILADVDLADRASGWSLRRAVWFRRGEPSPGASPPRIPPGAAR